MNKTDGKSYKEVVWCFGYYSALIKSLEYLDVQDYLRMSQALQFEDKIKTCRGVQVSQEGHKMSAHTHNAVLPF